MEKKMKIRRTSDYFDWPWILTLLFVIGVFCWPVASAEDEVRGLRLEAKEGHKALRQGS
jgi:hypothetical protein